MSNLVLWLNRHIHLKVVNSHLSLALTKRDQTEPTHREPESLVDLLTNREMDTQIGKVISRPTTTTGLRVLYQMDNQQGPLLARICNVRHPLKECIKHTLIRTPTAKGFLAPKKRMLNTPSTKQH
ncbi:MAG: hypothetical protein L6R42_000067 [Xanthoria sp. 1 TBL-2021]|nr:MAG: hypothetical protein L6R42_000067 [Xanthoria sp. 1 TBL-2021]